MSDYCGKEITRRGFLTKVGQGLAVANVARTLGCLAIGCCRCEVRK
jgi:hypothetical protein